MPQPRFADFANWSAFEFLVSLVLMIVATPVVEGFRYGPLVEAILLTFMLASAVLAVSDRRSTLITTMLRRFWASQEDGRTIFDRISVLPRSTWVQAWVS